MEYLGQIRPDDIPFLEFGQYPAIEALALAVLKGRERAANLEAWRRHREEGPLRPFSPMAGDGRSLRGLPQLNQ